MAAGTGSGGPLAPAAEAAASVARTGSRPPSSPGTGCRSEASSRAPTSGDPCHVYCATCNVPRVLCHVRTMVCEICGATGDQAHTKTYCPHNQVSRVTSLPALLSNTLRRSPARWRCPRCCAPPSTSQTAGSGGGTRAGPPGPSRAGRYAFKSCRGYGRCAFTFSHDSIDALFRY